MLGSLAILSSPLVSTQLGLGMILSPATTLFQQKLIHTVGLGQYVDRSLSQSLPTLGTCQVPGAGLGRSSQYLSGAGWCRSSQHLSGAGIGIGPRCTPRSDRVQCLSGTGMWQSVRYLSGTSNQGGVAPVNFQTSHLHRSYGTWQDLVE